MRFIIKGLSKKDYGYVYFNGDSQIKVIFFNRTKSSKLGKRTRQMFYDMCEVINKHFVLKESKTVCRGSSRLLYNKLPYIKLNSFKEYLNKEYK